MESKISGQLFLWRLLCLPLLSARLAANAQHPTLPHLQKKGTATQLGGGRPFLIRGGELGNSSSSSAEYMRSVWQRLAKMNLNAVLVPFYRELIEPEEGKFDFTLLDELLRDTRRQNLKIVESGNSFGAGRRIRKRRVARRSLAERRSDASRSSHSSRNKRVFDSKSKAVTLAVTSKLRQFTA